MLWIQSGPGGKRLDTIDLSDKLTKILFLTVQCVLLPITLILTQLCPRPSPPRVTSL